MTTVQRRPRAAGTPVGILLAAGAGRRMGRPKALVHDRDGTSWLVRSSRVLRDGGCGPVLVVLGARHEEARELLTGTDVEVVLARDWGRGLGASLRVGLEAAAGTGAPAALVSLVDLPDVDEAVVRRVVAAGWSGSASLARATYRGRPGHPVLLGADHWAELRSGSLGDKGARDYLATRTTDEIECSDLATGEDVDHPDPLP